MKSTLVLMLLLFVGDDMKTVSFYENSKENIRECVFEANALNSLIEHACQETDEEEAERILRSTSRSNWVDADDMEDSRFECDLVLVVP